LGCVNCAPTAGQLYLVQHGGFRIVGRPDKSAVSIMAHGQIHLGLDEAKRKGCARLHAQPYASTETHTRARVCTHRDTRTERERERETQRERQTERHRERERETESKRERAREREQERAPPALHGLNAHHVSSTNRKLVRTQKDLTASDEPPWERVGLDKSLGDVKPPGVPPPKLIYCHGKSRARASMPAVCAAV
jgi:hypothetical protein